jgi:hypothetical protein
MHASEVREVVGVVAPEVGEELCVFIEAEELTDDLYGEDLRVGELWGGTALTEPMLSFELIVYQAKDGNDEGAKIHEQKTSFCSRWIGAPPRVGRSSVWLKCSMKLAHGVN